VFVGVVQFAERRPACPSTSVLNLGREVMPVQTSFPGIYIQELPSSTHTITASPTSVTVFVGYTHPFKTDPKTFGKPIEVFSFTDYQNAFGGFFRSTLFDAEAISFGDIAQSVNQFFLNGGSDAFVIGLPAQPLGQALTPGTAPIGPLTFTAREITDADHQMTVTVGNITPSPDSFSAPFSSLSDETCDVTIRFGPPQGSKLYPFGFVTETYRQVSIFSTTSDGKPNPNYIGTRIGISGSPVSALVTVQNPLVPGPLEAGSQIFGPTLSGSTTPSPGNIFSAAEFVNVFQQDTPLDKLQIFNLLVLPGVTNFSVLTAAFTFCERKLAFLIMDPPQADSVNGSVVPKSNRIQDDVESGEIIPPSTNSALYFPYLTSPDPLTGQTTNPFTNLPYEIPPSGTIAGIFAATDLNRGVWKAPAGLETTLANITDVVERGQMSDARQGVLNLIGVNCVRSFPGVGAPVVWGARTSISADVAFQQWKYVPVRRMALFLEQTLSQNLGWVVFEPNDDPLWTSIRVSIESFMLGLFRQGAFQGSTADEAFQVKCDSTTTSQDDINNGIVNIVVAFAPLKPAEFVVIQIAQLAGQAQTS
jgi:hypothetical protein